MSDFFRHVTYYLILIVEMSAVLIIGLASIRAIFKSFLYYFNETSRFSIETVRLQLARWLSLGLEFALAADIMKMGLNPTWNEIGQLAAIAVLRTALNYFIQKEIESVVEQREHI